MNNRETESTTVDKDKLRTNLEDGKILRKKRKYRQEVKEQEQPKKTMMTMRSLVSIMKKGNIVIVREKSG